MKEARIHFCIKLKSQRPEKTAAGFMVTWSLPFPPLTLVCEMHVLSNHYYMPSGTLSSSSHGQVSLKCSTAVILMTLNEKGIWKRRDADVSSRCAICHREKYPAAAGLRECPPADGRQMSGLNSRFGKRQREKIATRGKNFFPSFFLRQREKS